MHNVAKICRKAIDILKKHADSGGEEAFEDTLGEITRCLRVLTMIGGSLLSVGATGGRCFRRPRSQKDHGGQVHAEVPNALSFAVKFRLMGADRRVCCQVRNDCHARSPD